MKSYHFLKLAMIGLATLSANTSQASVITHSEAHVSNFQIVSGANDLIWNSWQNITAAGAFDDLSGFSGAYDDDPGGTGTATSTAATQLVSTSATASSNTMKIDFHSDINNPSNDDIAANALSYGELYNTFQVKGNAPVTATFSVNWSATLSSQSSPSQVYYNDYAVQMKVSDGVSEWSKESFYVLSGSGPLQTYSDVGIFILPLTLKPNTLYSIDIIAHPDPYVESVPEPSEFALMATGSLLLPVMIKMRRKSAVAQSRQV